MAQSAEHAGKAELEALVRRLYKDGISFEEAIDEFAKQFIITALKANHGNRVQTARQLGMHRNTLTRTIKRLAIDVQSICGTRRREPQSTTLVSKTKLSGRAC
jgi:Fis family transcriptional regulator, factor for inversion stimulation protein